jgi:hypothetical protein
MSEQAITTEPPKNLGGRPSDYNDEVVRKLTGALQLGLSISTACDVAGISRDTYYSWLEKKEGFSDKMTQAQHYPTVLAGNIVSDVLQDSLRGKLDTKSGKQIPYKYGEQTRVNTAKWMLEKKERQSFGTQTVIGAKLEDDGKGGKTATLFYGTTDTDISKFREVIVGATANGNSPIAPLELLETDQTEDVAGGTAEGSPTPVHPEELQGEYTEGVSVPQP